MIDERMEEQAALHVLGALSETEAREFKRAMQADPELKNFVAGLSLATTALAGAIPLIDPPPQLRSKILAQIEPPQKIISLPERKFSPMNWWPWSFATCLAILCILLFAQDSKLQNQIGTQTQRLNESNQLAQSLQSATNNLAQVILALQETNRLSNLRIAMLKSLLSDDPKAVAVSLWDNAKQEGVFVVQNLKPLPDGRDYQLWVIDPQYKTPVNAGVFQVDDNGNVRLEFKARATIGTAKQFAVTEEIKGGVATPTLKNMVLAGN
jgi:anti-sigma-K factor RskA